MLLLVFKKEKKKKKSLRSTGCLTITATCLLFAFFPEALLFLQNKLEMLRTLCLVPSQYHLV